MALVFEPSSDGPLRQGEVLSGVWRHEVDAPASALEEGAGASILSRDHARMVVLSAECDLLWDFQARFAEESRTEYGPEREGIDEEGACLAHVLLVDAFEKEDIRDRVPGSDVWRRVARNQDERYHCLAAAEVAGTGDGLPELFLDFKRAWGVPTRGLYRALSAGALGRLGVVPPIHVHDLMHRFYAFLSRVGVPE